MIITSSKPYSVKQIKQLREQFDIYIKTVIDIEKEICSAGCDLHADAEKLLLEAGSHQKDLWGGGINLETKEIDYNSFINIRPQQQNTGIEIQSPKIQDKFAAIMKKFFVSVYE